MHYIILGTHQKPLTATVKPGDAAYLINHCLPHLQAISETDYIEGFSVIQHSAARTSYILHNKKLYWLIEWCPGLLVLEFSSAKTMYAAALRSPHPYFGGREPLAIDDLDYDEDAENHQYNLIFNAWDAIFDKEYQERQHFGAASAVQIAQFTACLAYSDRLGEAAQTKFEPTYTSYLETAKNKITAWAGDGIIVQL